MRWARFPNIGDHHYNDVCAQVVDIPTPPSVPQSQPPRLTFDPEWLAITRALHPFFCTTKAQATLPNPDDARALVATELEWVRRNVPDGGLQEVSEVQKFWRTAPGPIGNPKEQHRPRKCLLTIMRSIHDMAGQRPGIQTLRQRHLRDYCSFPTR